MQTRTLGRLPVPAQGLGCRGMSEFDGTADMYLTRIDAAAPVGAAVGKRYPDMSSVHR